MFESKTEVDVSPCKIVERVRQKLLDRSIVGLNKYGLTLESHTGGNKEFLIHLQEELLDAANYIEKLLSLERE